MHSYEIVLLRHGESEWNLENRFTGWTDVGLTPNGIQEAQLAACVLQENGFTFDRALTSVLRRAVHTLWIILDKMDLMWIPVERDWRLNERHYGALQGLNKAETAEQLGKDLVHAWRRSYKARPPALEASDPRHPRFDPRYLHLSDDQIPASESLEDTYQRVQPWWNEQVLPRLLGGERLLVVAHGNSLRALVKMLDQISDEEIPGLNIPTGVPLVYKFDAGMRISEKKYLDLKSG